MSSLENRKDFIIKSNMIFKAQKKKKMILGTQMGMAYDAILLCDNNILKLTNCRRSNSILFNLIQFENIPNLEKSVFSNKETEINICWTNETRKLVNDKYMKLAYKKDRTRYYFKIPKLQYDENSQDVILVRKTPLIAKVNNSKLNLINNERYTITKIDVDNQEITVQNNRNEVIIESSDFQKLFRVGYAFTAHSCQGLTINEPYTIHEFDIMHKKLKYVVLSRSSKYEYINII
jgi:nitrogen regulatory protein PII-like uncharacterized protein